MNLDRLLFAKYGVSSIFFAFTLLIAKISLAGLPQYELTVQDTGGARFKVAHTYGSYSGKSKKIFGHFGLDEEKGVVGRGELGVPLLSFGTGSSRLDCYLRQSLGFDGSLTSKESQNCEEAPSSSSTKQEDVRYRSLVFRVLRGKRLSRKGQIETYEVWGKWKIRGRESLKPIRLVLRMDRKKRTLSGEAGFRFRDYGILVSQKLGELAPGFSVRFDYVFSRVK